MPAPPAQRAIVVHGNDLYREPDVTDFSICVTPSCRYQRALIMLSGRALISVGEYGRRCQRSLTAFGAPGWRRVNGNGCIGLAQAERADQIFLRFSSSGMTPMAMPPMPTTLVTQSKVGML